MSNPLPENHEKVRWNDSKFLADQKVVVAKWNMHRTHLEDWASCPASVCIVLTFLLFLLFDLANIVFSGGAYFKCFNFSVVVWLEE